MGTIIGFILQTLGIFWIIIIVISHIFFTDAVNEFLIEDNLIKQLTVIATDFIVNIPGIILIIFGRKQSKRSKLH